MNRLFARLAAVVAVAACSVSGGTATPGPTPQSDSAFAGSDEIKGVHNSSATTQQRSCYTPEVEYLAGAGYPGYADGGGTACPGANTGEDIGPYAQQDVTNDPLLVKDHSESDIRVDPNNPDHLIGQSKWFVNAQGYNHLLGFYESWDGGTNWTVQGHVPGYE